ncbi:hypothetical protein J45TS6_16570 [Paenibacillus sp. J45TS6]|uniref:Kiwa anti-phage protein KwaB-like domain-containing protein n=1 Tax=Paenibacillus sp. J45TS6 TaxID=2807196 RepID=UPI001B283128|nr:Kiwa anti-phage protein KwaB-like domain-containing protein [Paenibacillus sp. J45TS6]GIP43198.1 hypothetical protein J45TS6_16570 [Paenibacillus sp. J45TS6]
MATTAELVQLKTIIQNAANRSANLYMIQKPKTRNPQFPFIVQRARNSNAIATAFIELFLLHLDKAIKDDETVPYDINLDSNDYIQYIDSASVPNAAVINNEIANPNVTQLQAVDNDFFKTIWAYAVKIQFDGEELIFYRKYSNGKILSRNTFDAIMLRNGIFSAIEEDVFQIDPTIDAFTYNNEIIILHMTNFERIFGYEELYEAAATSALQQISATHNFVDIAELTGFVDTDSRKKRKLAAIQRNNLIPNMGFSKIRKTIVNYNLQINIDVNNQRFELTKENALRFLKALNDDYLRSEATKNRYEATSKRRS